MPIMVELRRVCKRFGAVTVLDEVSFRIRRGQVLALIGPSGCGKSTVLRCINALETIASGEITVCHHAVHAAGLDRQRLRRDVGIVFQGYNLFPHLSVAQNVMLALTCVKRMAKDTARALASEALERVGLADKMAHWPEQLSGGQQQRVAIARALAMQPQLMLFDEVTSALDPQLTGEVLDVMRQLAADGMTMLVVTHEMSFARQVADQVVFMHQGKVREHGPADLLDAPRTPELRSFIGNGL